jgi:hypothetical protein
MEITRRLGYKNSSYLYKYFSELSRSISRRYKDYVKTCGVETRNRIREEIQTIASKLHFIGSITRAVSNWKHKLAIAAKLSFH